MLVAIDVDPLLQPIANLIVELLKPLLIDCIIPTLSSARSPSRRLRENITTFKDSSANLLLVLYPLADGLAGPLVSSAAINGKVYGRSIVNAFEQFGFLNNGLQEASSLDMLTVGIAATRIDLDPLMANNPNCISEAIVAGVLDVVYSF